MTLCLKQDTKDEDSLLKTLQSFKHFFSDLAHIHQNIANNAFVTEVIAANLLAAKTKTRSS